MHAVQRLYQYRKSLSNNTFQSRGYKLERCQGCCIAVERCICTHKPSCQSEAAFLLLMYDDEVLKPSNTGRLIADLIDDTHAFLWSRTEPSTELLALLDDPQWQPLVVFPESYAAPERPVVNQVPASDPNKRPLFILLDGTWREAKKMFRKSPYLDQFPVLSMKLDEGQPVQTITHRHRVRQAGIDGQLATAEVAARVLDSYGEHHNAQLLDLWFDVFSYHIQQGVCIRNEGREDPLQHLQSFVTPD